MGYGLIHSDNFKEEQMQYKEGKWIYKIAQQLFPICRSITGDGVRATLGIIKEYIPKLEIFEIPTGTQVFDWIIPKEWNIKDAYVTNSAGKKIIDFQKCNLHVLGYSTPVDKWVGLDELKQYLYSEPSQPDVIPYVTSYYEKRFGFCVSQIQKDSLEEDQYHMVIDSELKNGSMTLGEIIIPGETKEEIFFSTYICHPSMANNECSGPALAVALIKWIQNINKRKYTYRFIFVPETIGSIAYLNKNLNYLKTHMLAGYNLSCVGDNHHYSIVESRYANTLSDKVLNHVLSYQCDTYCKYSFLNRGSDERQYNAPGVDLPVVTFCRSKFSEYQEYHTSADNLDFISPEGFQGSFEVMTNCINILEHNAYYQTTVLCEPQLGKRGLYPTISQKGTSYSAKDMMNFLAYSDGTNDLVDICNKIHASCMNMIKILPILVENQLLKIKEKEHE